MRILMALQLRGTSSWVWPLVTGIVAVLLGSVIAARWPISGLWVIGLFVAIEMIIHGWSCIVIALVAKAGGEAAPAESGSPKPA